MPRQRRGRLGGFVPQITTHTRSGTTRETFLPDARTASDVQSAHYEPPASCIEMDDGAAQSSSGPSQYAVAKQQNVENWVCLRRPILEAAWDSVCPTTENCTVCKEARIELVRCVTCGPQYFCCQTCIVACHELQPLHSLEIWRVCNQCRWFSVLV